MVELVDDFEKLKAHASYCRIIGYKVESAGKNLDSPPKSLFRIRIRAGSYAWDKVVDEDATKVILIDHKLWDETVAQINRDRSVLDEALKSAKPLFDKAFEAMKAKMGEIEGEP